MAAALFSGAGERYGAFRLTAGGPSGWHLVFKDLGEAAVIDSLTSEYRRVIEMAGTTMRPSARLEAEYRPVARGLYEKLWAPLHEAARPDTAGARIAYLLPTSRL